MLGLGIMLRNIFLLVLVILILITGFFIFKKEPANNTPVTPVVSLQETPVASTTEKVTITPITLTVPPVAVTQEKTTPVITTTLPDPHKYTTATIFWVGEKSGPENGFISNKASAWDQEWQKHFGGVDSPDCRDGFYPCEFVPKENPFYIALPYNDIDESGKQKDSARDIPWYENKQNNSILKNHWVEVSYEDKICYGQWEDVGPFESDDFNYVFGQSDPKNEFGLKAGIDLSPALRDCLEMRGNATVGWKFVDSQDVAIGPWLEIVTGY